MTEGTVFQPETRLTATTVGASAFPQSYIQWGPAFAGAVVTASLFFVLMTFAAAIGLAVTSVSPTWRDTSVGLTVLSGAWVVFSAVGSFALGGYIAGRIRSTWQTNADEIHFRDGLHGLVVWGLAVIIGAGLAWAGASTITRSTTTTNVPNSSSATNEPRFLTFELDRLFRSDRRPEGSDTQARAEAGRILETGLGRRNLAKDDRDYLVRLVSAQTGLAASDADRRVTQVVSEAQDSAAKARRSAVILAFTLAAGLVAAAGAAWGCAIAGGKHRDENIAPSLFFRQRRQVTASAR
jgi:hypothetical protein